MQLIDTMMISVVVRLLGFAAPIGSPESRLIYACCVAAAIEVLAYTMIQDSSKLCDGFSGYLGYIQLVYNIYSATYCCGFSGCVWALFIVGGAAEDIIASQPALDGLYLRIIFKVCYYTLSARLTRFESYSTTVARTIK